MIDGSPRNLIYFGKAKVEIILIHLYLSRQKELLQKMERLRVLQI